MRLLVTPPASLPCQEQSSVFSVCLCHVICLPYLHTCILRPQIEQTADGKPVNLGESKLWGAKRFLAYTKQQPSPREVSLQCRMCGRGRREEVSTCNMLCMLVRQSTAVYVKQVLHKRGLCLLVCVVPSVHCCTSCLNSVPCDYPSVGFCACKGT